MVARSTGRRRCTGLLPRTVKILAEAPGLVVSEAGSYRVSAAGLLGEQPLVTWNNVGKGTRQTRSVTSGQGLALRIEAGLVGRPQRPRVAGRGLGSHRPPRPRSRHSRRRQTRRQAGYRRDPVPATLPAFVAAEGADQPREVNGAVLRRTGQLGRCAPRLPTALSRRCHRWRPGNKRPRQLTLVVLRTVLGPGESDCLIKTEHREGRTLPA